MNISVFGLGYVGCVSMGCLAKNGHNLIGVDVSRTKVDLINSGKATIIEKDIDKIIQEQFNLKRIKATLDYNDAVLNSEISIICVGTPTSPEGHLNTEYIINVINDIGTALKNKKDFHVIAIRSTVLPGTCEKCSIIIEKLTGKKRNVDFAVLSNPEFLREGTAVSDYYNPPYTLIGADDISSSEKLAIIYKDLSCELIVTELRIAEMIKYVNNTFHALKICFANEVGNICKNLDIDSHKVMEIFIKDSKLNISPYYLKPGFAYGGSCLPKDLKALQTLAHDHYIDTPVIQSIDKSNEVQIKHAIDLIIKQNKKNIGFIGISFKSGTDDLRNSPSVKVVEYLIGKGYKVSIYDKEVSLSNLTGTNREFIEKHLPHLKDLIVDSFDVLKNSSDVLVISQKDSELVKELENIPDELIILDFVRVPNSFLSRENYVGICW